MTVNAPTQINVLDRQLANESQIRLKRGRPIGSKDITPRKRRTQRRIDTLEEVHDKQKAPMETYDKQQAPEEAYNKQKAPEEAYNKQKAPVEAFIEQVEK